MDWGTVGNLMLLFTGLFLSAWIIYGTHVLIEETFGELLAALFLFFALAFYMALIFGYLEHKDDARDKEFQEWLDERKEIRDRYSDSGAIPFDTREEHTS